MPKERIEIFVSKRKHCTKMVVKTRWKGTILLLFVVDTRVFDERPPSKFKVGIPLKKVDPKFGLKLGRQSIHWLEDTSSLLDEPFCCLASKFKKQPRKQPLL